jgi:hypothetical protein
MLSIYIYIGVNYSGAVKGGEMERGGAGGVDDRHRGVVPEQRADGLQTIAFGRVMQRRLTRYSIVETRFFRLLLLLFGIFAYRSRFYPGRLYDRVGDERRHRDRLPTPYATAPDLPRRTRLRPLLF